MEFTKKDIIEEIKEDLNDTFNYDANFRIIDADVKKKTVTVEFDVHIVEDDNYIGLRGY